MLQGLFIKNYAIIEKVQVDFDKGLNVITGETGAGKSILLGALGLIMGKRADTKLLFDRTQKCVVEGTFKIPVSYKEFFEKNDIDYETETHIRREITPAGKSRAFINDTPTTLPVIKTLTATLVDLHQQFDTLDIHNVSFQMNIIDALAEHKKEVAEYREEYSFYHHNKKRLSQLLGLKADQAKELDFLTFQLDELEEAELMMEEDVQAEEELKSLAHAEDIQRVLGGTHRYLTEDENAIVAQLKNISLEINAISKFSQEVEQLQSKLDSFIYEMEDLAGEMEILAEKTTYNPERIQELRERLDLIYRLQNKHQVSSVKELLVIQTDLQDKLKSQDDLDEEIDKLEKIIAKQEQILSKEAQLISKKRKGVVPTFEKKIKAQLGLLNMPHAVLKAEFTKSEELTADGIDRVEFLFSANKGSELEAIKDVASGGELSRLTLCIKSLVAGALSMPTMIFDEIDTGVSGDVALKMGSILKNLSAGHQIITITHTPQIAVQGDQHFFVYKDHEGEKTTTSVNPLAKKERVVEIATMLSGNPPSKSALKNAKELLESV